MKILKMRDDTQKKGGGKHGRKNCTSSNIDTI